MNEPRLKWSSGAMVRLEAPWILVHDNRQMSAAKQNPVPPPPSIHTCALSSEQAAKLKELLHAQGWEFDSRPYMLFFAQRQKTTVAVYEKGPKIVVQGKGVQEFVQFILEPEILGEARLGYEEVHHPEWFSPHLGIDESGKGDFFGPLVIAGAFADAEMARHWRAAGIQDSKSIGSDARIRDLAKVIRGTPGAAVNVVSISPERYNQLYKKFGNLNRLLAWGHARVIENLLEIRPDCPRALSDQFANPSLIRSALMERGRGILLEQRTKAESDPAVAAASILAREAFVDWMDKQSKIMGFSIPRGASKAVKEAGARIVQSQGREGLEFLSKAHFKTSAEILAESAGNQGLPNFE
jgi:ribonuclease HIII